MKAILFLLLMEVSIVSSGQTIFVRGLPTPLEQRGDIYFLSPTYVISRDITYLYVTMDGINKVCFLNTEPTVMYDYISHINIFINEIKTEWNCFPYKTTIIEIRP